MFRWLPQDPVRAKAMVCDLLPPQLASKVVAVRRLESTFVSEHLRRSQSDGLLEVEFEGGEFALAYVVFEHKAGPTGIKRRPTSPPVDPMYNRPICTARRLDMAGKGKGRNSPFMPDVTDTPPHLAGRDKETAIWDRHLDTLKGVGDDGRPCRPRGNIVLMQGPRGMGKTALLDRFAEMALERGIDVAHQQATAFREGPDALARKLLERARKARYEKESVSTGGNFVAGFLGLAARVKRVWVDPKATGSLQFKLGEQCKLNPMAALIDEAHAIEGKDGLAALQEIVNAGQRLNREGTPFMLVLAGTPGLRNTLAAANCSFILRQIGEEVSLGIGRLEEKAAIDAIRKPLEDQRWRLAGGKSLTLDPLVIRKLLDDSENYPYFLQQWGKELWDHAVRTGKAHLGLDDVAAVDKAVQVLRARFYAGMGAELQPGFMPEAAIAVAEVFADAAPGCPPTQSIAHAAIAAALEPEIPRTDERRTKAKELLDGLMSLGYCWQETGDERLAAGIPSFMKYAVRTFSPPARKAPTVLDKRTGQAYLLGELTGMDSDSPKCLLRPAGTESAAPLEADAASLTALYRGDDAASQALLEERQQAALAAMEKAMEH